MLPGEPCCGSSVVCGTSDFVSLLSDIPASRIEMGWSLRRSTNTTVLALRGIASVDRTVENGCVLRDEWIYPWWGARHLFSAGRERQFDWPALSLPIDAAVTADASGDPILVAYRIACRRAGAAELASVRRHFLQFTGTDCLTGRRIFRDRGRPGKRHRRWRSVKDRQTKDQPKGAQPAHLGKPVGFDPPW